MKNVKKEEIPQEEELLPILYEVAKLKDLQVFIFREDNLKKYYPNSEKDIGVALMANNEDNAIYNIKNLRRCYLYKLKDTVS